MRQTIRALGRIAEDSVAQSFDSVDVGGHFVKTDGDLP